MSWREFLTVRGVLIPPRGQRTCAGAPELDWCERKLKARLPADYRRFAQEIGAGTLGDIDFIVPGRARRGGLHERPAKQPGLLSRLRGGTLEGRDRLLDHVRLARRAIDAIGLRTDPEDAISFAATAEGDWFYYSSSELAAGSSAAIYLASADLDDCMPCAADLAEFIDQICLGPRLVELGLYETLTPPPLREFYPVVV